jgi:hypothetical protein
MKATSRVVVAALAAVVIIAGAVRTVDAQKDKPKKKDLNPIGAWFGIARPCPADAATDGPVHVAFCQQVCGICPNIPGTLPPEVPMMPTLLADGTVLADDAGELSLYHTTAHGKWEVSEDDGLPDREGTTRFRATFFWLGQTGPTNRLDNAVRPRFVTYFDPSDPDRMIGFIQPYFFPIATGGLVVVNPFDPTDPFAGNHLPAIDPLVSPLPEGCQLDKGCLGTYHFVIRRIKAR